MYWEVPLIVQRLCGICPVSHHLCAAKAMDRVAGVDQLTPTAEKMRRLMHYGQVFQSHALHFFHLASPDLLFGFDAPPEKRNIIAVLNEFPEIGKWAILMRKFGQEVIKATGGREDPRDQRRAGRHQPQPGRRGPRRAAEGRRPDRRMVAGRAGPCTGDYVAANQTLHRAFAALRSNFLSLVGPAGGMDLYDGTLRAIDPEGKSIFDGVPPRDYRAASDRGGPVLELPEVPASSARCRGRRAGTASARWRRSTAATASTRRWPRRRAAHSCTRTAAARCSRRWPITGRG